MKLLVTLLGILAVAGVAHAQCSPSGLTTTFADNNGQSGNMFDVVALADVTICDFECNLDAGTWDIEVWAMPTNTSWTVDPANANGMWTRIASLSGVVSNGGGVGTPLGAALGVSVPAGATQAFYLTGTAPAVPFNYTNGTQVGAVYAADANLQVLEGAGMVYPFSTIFTPRVWNGVVHYCGGTNALCPSSSAPDYQVNQPDATLLANAGGGAPQTNGAAPAIVPACAGTMIDVSATSSGLAGNLYDIGINVGSGLIPAHITTIGGQVFNADPATAIWHNGGVSPAFIPFANFTLPIVALPNLLACAQLGILDPTTVDGFVLSQGVEFDFSAGGPASSVPGPAGDDQVIQFNLNSQQFCGSGGVSFYGTVYSDVYVSSNGRVNLVSGDADFSPTIAELTTDSPFVGLWTDLNPSAAGSIDVFSDLSGSFCVAYTNVPYFGELGTATSHTICFEAGGDVTIDVSGCVPNPLMGVSFAAGDAQLIGITNGNLGNPMAPMPANLGMGVVGAVGDPVFDFWDGSALSAPNGVNLVESIQTVQAAGQTTIRFTDTGGAYSSTSF